MQVRLYQSIWTTVDWLFPPVCVGCGQAGERWCEACMHNALRVDEKCCTLCGARLPVDGKGHACPRVSGLDEVYAWGKYQNPLGNAIRRLKYARDVALGDTLSRLLFQLSLERHVQPEMVIPVPLSRKRLRERGYNQAALLARPLAWMLGVPFRGRAVSRIRDTASQVGLSISERRENVHEAFSAQKTEVTGKHVLVVDDVLTTGATLDAVAMALKEAGAARVSGMVVARA